MQISVWRHTLQARVANAAVEKAVSLSVRVSSSPYVSMMLSAVKDVFAAVLAAESLKGKQTCL